MMGDGLEECVDEDEEDEDGKMEWSVIGEEDGDDDDDDDAEEEEDEEDNDGNEVTPGDVFALEMELNRENKKMMKVSRSPC